MSGSIIMSSHECITGFCKVTGLERVYKLVLTAEAGNAVKMDVSCYPDEAAVGVLLNTLYQFEVKEVPGSGHTLISFKDKE